MWVEHTWDLYNGIFIMDTNSAPCWAMPSIVTVSPTFNVTPVMILSGWVECTMIWVWFQCSNECSLPYFIAADACHHHWTWAFLCWSQYGGGGGFFLTCENFGRMWDHSFPVWTFFLPALYIRIGQQWLSKLRWLWLSVPWWVACDLCISFPDRFSH